MSRDVAIQVAIPSHARARECNDKTLATLARGGIAPERIHVFVTIDQLDDYRATLDPGLYGELRPGREGLDRQRGIIAVSYDEGTPLVQMDDDIADVRRKVDDKNHETVGDLDALFREGFARCAEHDVGMWGVYPTLNPMFMKHRTVVGLKFCIGQLFGLINSHDPELQCTVAQKEDYERTLLWWERHGAVVRFDDVACKSKMYAPGGMQAEGAPDRRRMNRHAVAALMARWPERVKVSKRRSDQVGLEIRLVEPK